MLPSWSSEIRNHGCYSVYRPFSDNPSGLNIDDPTIQNGTYWVNPSVTPGTYPTGRQWGFLLVFKPTNGTCLQMFFNNSDAAFRVYVNGAWASWVEW